MPNLVHPSWSRGCHLTRKSRDQVLRIHTFRLMGIHPLSESALPCCDIISSQAAWCRHLRSPDEEWEGASVSPRKKKRQLQGRRFDGCAMCVLGSDLSMLIAMMSGGRLSN